MNRKKWLSVVTIGLVVGTVLTGCQSKDAQIKQSTGGSAPVAVQDGSQPSAGGAVDAALAPYVEKINTFFTDFKKENDLDKQLALFKTFAQEKADAVAKLPGAAALYDAKLEDMKKAVMNHFNKDLKLNSLKEAELKDADFEGAQKLDGLANLKGEDLEKAIQDMAESVNLKYKSTLIKNKKNLGLLQENLGKAKDVVLDEATFVQYKKDTAEQEEALGKALGQVEAKEKEIIKAIKAKLG